MTYNIKKLSKNLKIWNKGLKLLVNIIKIINNQVYTKYYWKQITFSKNLMDSDMGNFII